MKTLRPALVLAVTLVGCATSETEPQPSTPAPPPARPDPPGPPPPAAHVAVCPEGTPFTSKAGKILVEASLDGGAPKTWVLDTGAPTSAIDVALADSVRNRDVTIAVAGIEKTVRFSLFDTIDVKSALRLDVAGILGQDVFGDVLTLDYPRGRVFVDRVLDADRDADLRACAHVEGAPATVDAIHAGYFFVRGRAEGRDGYLLVDSGASLGAVRKSAFAELDQAKPRPSLGGFYTPSGIGTFWARLTSIASIEVGGKKVSHVPTRTVDDALLRPPAAIPSTDFVGVVPSLYLKHFMVTLDFVAKKLRLDAERGDDLREPTMFTTVGIGLGESTSAPVVIADVLPGSAAAEAGIVPGDELVAIDGTAVTALDPYTRPFRLLASTTGTSIRVTVKHDGTSSETTLVTRDLLVAPTD